MYMPMVNTKLALSPWSIISPPLFRIIVSGNTVVAGLQLAGARSADDGVAGTLRRSGNSKGVRRASVDE